MLSSAVWLLVVFAGFAVVIGHGVYFSHRFTRAVADIANVPPIVLRRVRHALVVVAVSLPLAIACYAVYLRIASPESNGAPGGKVFDYLVAYPFWALAIWSFQCTLFIVPVDVVHLLARALGRGRDAVWFRRKSGVVVGIAAVFAVVVGVGVLAGASRLDVRQFEYASSSIPADLDGYRIAFIADMQADQYTDDDRLLQLVQTVNRLQPDLVVIAGDMVTRGPDYVDAAAEYAGKLLARHGVYAAVGDHDNWVFRGTGSRKRSVAAIAAALARHGVAMLDNQVARVAVGEASVGLIVATNNYVNRIRPEVTRELIAAAEGTDVQILVAHQTGDQLVADAAAGGVELFLGGHTHGGQIRFVTPLGDLFVIRFETPFVTGAYRVGDMQLIVTSGLGVSVAPYRYRAPATVELITLRRP